MPPEYVAVRFYDKKYNLPSDRFIKCYHLQGSQGHKGSAAKPGRPGFIGPPGPTVSVHD